MKNISAVLVSLLAGAAVAAPLVSGVAVTQTDSRRVTVAYTLSGEPAIITADVLTNGVSVGGRNLAYFAGDVNRLVRPGSRSLSWRPDRSWPDCDPLPSVDVVVRAWSTNAPPDYAVLSLVARDAVRYFATPESPFARADGRPNEPKDSQTLGRHFAQALAVFIREDLKPIPRETPGDRYAKEIPRNLKLVWSDEFCGAELDPSKWIYERGFVRNDEPQRYTDSTNNVRVADGRLIIEARRGKGADGKSVEYTSGSVQTRGKFAFRYGRVDVRAKLPGGQSTWPAIWTMGVEKAWPACGEMDVMEYWGNQPGDPQGNFHWKPANADKTNQHASSGAFHCVGRNPTDHFHLYTMEWTPDRVVLRYDGEKYADFDVSKADLPDGSNAFRDPHYLLLNLALLPGRTQRDRDLLAGDSFPQRFEVDYVRVYAEDETCGIRVSPREVFVNHQANGRSGHMGHALVDCGGGRILDFYSNCDGKRVGGHSGYGWMEYRISTDYGRTFGPARVLAYSKKVYEEGRHTALCEKAIKAPDGRILLFFQITDASKPISCEPWSAPTMAVSTDDGETFSDGVEVGIDPGRIYDVKSDGRDVFVFMQSNDASVSFLGNRPEHCYKLYRMGKNGTFVPQTLPIDAKGKGYGALCFAPDGALFAYVYGQTHETELEYVVSRDSGRTWSEPSRTHCAKKIRNPQVSRIGDAWMLVGRNGGNGDGIVLYQSADGVTWDEGRLLDYRPTRTGTGYYSNLLPICEPGRVPRFLLQYSHVYDGNCVNIAHRWLTLPARKEAK